MKCNYKRREENIVHSTLPINKEHDALEQAIKETVVSGKCINCSYLENCKTSRSFKFPKDALCMKRKDEILKEGNNA